MIAEISKDFYAQREHLRQESFWKHPEFSSQSLAAGAAEKNQDEEDDDPPHIVAIKQIAKTAVAHNKNLRVVFVFCFLGSSRFLCYCMWGRSRLTQNFPVDFAYGFSGSGKNDVWYVFECPAYRKVKGITKKVKKQKSQSGMRRDPQGTDHRERAWLYFRPAFPGGEPGTQVSGVCRRDQRRGAEESVYRPCGKAPEAL